MHQCFSLEFHLRNANASGPDVFWFIFLFIFAHICLCPCVCLLLIPPFFQPPVGPRTPPLAPRCPLRAHMHMHAWPAGVITWAGRSGALCPALGPNNPVCSWPHVCALRTSTSSTHSLLLPERSGVGSHRKWPDSHTCFLSTEIPVRWAGWESRVGQPAALCSMEANRECKKQAGALFSLSETSMNNSGACHNTPEPCFISSQRCHKVNTSRAVAFYFSVCLAARPLLFFFFFLSCSALLRKGPHILPGISSAQACLGPSRESTSWCEVRCYLSQPSERGVDSRTGVRLCCRNWLSLSFRGHQQL